MPRSGVTYNRFLEWRFAAQWALYRYEDFVKLDGQLQSAHVAAYRISQQMASVNAREEAKAASRKPRKGGRR